MAGLLPAELAWYATGRFYKACDGSLADYGYFLHLPFLDVPLFDGERGETHAHFTFAARPFRATNLQNGTLTLGLDPVGEFSLYLQCIPASTFDESDVDEARQGRAEADPSSTSLATHVISARYSTPRCRSSPLRAPPRTGESRCARNC